MFYASLNLSSSSNHCFPASMTTIIDTGIPRHFTNKTKRYQMTGTQAMLTCNAGTRIHPYQPRRRPFHPLRPLGLVLFNTALNLMLTLPPHHSDLMFDPQLLQSTWPPGCGRPGSNTSMSSSVQYEFSQTYRTHSLTEGYETVSVRKVSAWCQFV